MGSSRTALSSIRVETLPCLPGCSDTCWWPGGSYSHDFWSGPPSPCLLGTQERLSAELSTLASLRSWSLPSLEWATVFLSNGLSLMGLIWTMVSPSDSVSETSFGVDNGFFSNSMSVTSLAFGWFSWIFNGRWCQEWAAVDKFCLFFTQRPVGGTW